MAAEVAVDFQAVVAVPVAVIEIDGEQVLAEEAPLDGKAHNQIVSVATIFLIKSSRNGEDLVGTTIQFRCLK